MELKILKEIEMPLLARKRVNLEVDFEGPTPTEKDIIKNLASKLKTKEELIHLRHIYTKYGASRAKVIAHLYKTIDDLKNIEEIKKKKKQKEATQQNKEQQVKEEKKEVKEHGKKEKKE